MTQHEATRRIQTLRQSAVLGLLLLFSAPAAYSYSVLTHEAIIDSTWDSAIKPLLLKRFPDATADELTHAHAFAYGGCIIQDLGYYPFGSKLFSDLTHYVCQCRDKTPAILPTLPICAAVNLGGDAVGTLQ